jgi:hypothetical protein
LQTEPNDQLISVARLCLNGSACCEAARAEEKAADVEQSAEENAMSNWFEDDAWMWDKKDNISKDSIRIQNSKWFVARTVAPIQNPSSHKKIIAARSPKLDPLLICSGDFFSGQNLLHKLPRLHYVSYHGVYDEFSVVY